jgi:phage-related protein (TIGR01555 family)
VPLPPDLAAALAQPSPAAAGARARQARGDGWGSLLTGLGTTRDKRTSATFDGCRVSDAEARELWRGDDLAARAIEAYPAEMMRAGYEVTIQVDDNDEGGADRARETAEALHTALEELGVDEAVHTALEYERAFGGAGILPVGNDQQAALDTPLDLKKLVDVRQLTVFEPRELVATQFYADPTKPKFGRPSHYRLQPIAVHGAFQPSSVIVHESRLVIFPGIQVSRGARAQYPGWGDNVLSRIHEVLRDFNMGFGSASALLHDFAQAVYSIKGLHDAVASDEDDVIKRRMEIMDIGRSILRAIMLDAGGGGEAAESFHRESTSVTGIPELLDRLIYRLAAALELPVTLLMGMSPAGMNATGESDIVFFQKRVAQKQHRMLRPRLEQLIKIVFASKSGPTKGVEPAKWALEFNPLSQPTQKETAELRKLIADTDAVNINAGIYSPEDAARSHYGGDKFNPEIKVDFEALETMRAAEEERALAMAEAASTVPQPGAPPAPGGEKPAVPPAKPGDEDADE